MDFVNFYLASTCVPNWDGEIIVEDDRVIPADEKSCDVSLKEVRKKTWLVFQTAVKKLFSKERLEFILQRYNFELDAIADKGKLPLVRQMIEKIGIGAALPTVEDLEGGEFGNLPLQDLNVRYNRARQHAHVARPNVPLADVRGGPKGGHEYFIQDPFAQDCKLVSLFKGVEQLKWDTYVERLTMAINSHEMAVGTIVPAPGIDGKKDFYEVYHIVAGKGLYAVAFRPLSSQSYLSPILCFRCTQSSLGAIDAVHTWTNNAEKNIGQQGYDACEDMLNSLMENEKFHGWKKIKMAAYSLGGAHGGLFFRDHWQFISEAYFYRTVHNAEGVAEALANQINQLPAAWPGPYIYIERVKGDWASYAGSRHVGHGITHFGTFIQLTEWDVGEAPKDLKEWMGVHSVRTCDNKVEFPHRIYRSEELFHELDNKERGETIAKYEEARRSWGEKILAPVLDFFYRILGFIFRLMGIKIFRSSAD